MRHPPMGGVTRVAENLPKPFARRYPPRVASGTNGRVDVGSHIRSRLSILSPNERRIAAWLLEHMPEAAFETADSLARKVGVSKAAVVRFGSKLGFGGFAGLHDAILDGEEPFRRDREHGPALPQIQESAPFGRARCPQPQIHPYSSVIAPMMTTTVRAASVPSKIGAERAIRYTPAVTIVAAWMSADTGVGPSMASGNQVCNGN